MKTLYLDNAASTPLLDQVKSKMFDVMTDCYANSSSIHFAGVQSMKEVEKARELIANSLMASSEEIFFTSGGTEANNWVIQSLCLRRDPRRNVIVTSKIEHPSIRAPIQWVQDNWGMEVIEIGVDSNGVIDLNELKDALNHKVLFCTLMHVNNEVGSVQPIREAAELCSKLGIAFHVDACQSFLKLPIDLSVLELTYLTINAHKIHGPKGIGALYMRKGFELPALIRGGGHELNHRSGTLNVPAIAGFGKAVEIQKSKPATFNELTDNLNWLASQLQVEFPQCVINSPQLNRAPHILNIRFRGFLGKDIFWALNKAGIAISNSSACSSNKMTPSHVLKAMGLSDEENLESMRISIGLLSRKEELQNLIHKLKEIIK